MLYLGCHLSSSKGFLQMGKTALSIGANTFQFFTRNPRGSRAKELDPADAAALRALMEENSFSCVVAHAPYTLNACSSAAQTREFAEQTMADDLARLEYLPGTLYNFHPGSHVGQGEEEGIRLIAELLNRILRPEQQTTVLLETMAGKGSEVGKSFEELRAILERVELRDKMGVCLDTCHVHDAGYDIVNDLDGVLREFDRGLACPACVLCTSMTAKIRAAAGKIAMRKSARGNGLDAFARIVRHPLLQGLPLCLETPNELPGYAAEIALLRGLHDKKES